MSRRLIVSIAVVASCAVTAGMSLARASSTEPSGQSMKPDAGPQPFSVSAGRDVGTYGEPSAWDAAANRAPSAWDASTNRTSSLWDAGANRTSTMWEAGSSLWDAGANRVSGRLQGDGGSW
jgi:hypothetical protein